MNTVKYLGYEWQAHKIEAQRDPGDESLYSYFVNEGLLHPTIRRLYLRLESRDGYSYGTLSVELAKVGGDQPEVRASFELRGSRTSLTGATNAFHDLGDLVDLARRVDTNDFDMLWLAAGGG